MQYSAKSCIILEATMKKVWNLLLFAFFIFCLFLFKPREDVVFAAINESECIRLFETGNDFEFCVENSIRYRGTYTIRKDTVFLFYHDRINLATNMQDTLRPNFKNTLPNRLFINESTSTITAATGLSFSAEVYLDMRHESVTSATNNLRLLNNQKDVISAVGSQP